MPYRSAARTHVGTVRRRNEDAVLERPRARAMGGRRRRRGTPARRLREHTDHHGARRAQPELRRSRPCRKCESPSRRSQSSSFVEKAAAIGPGALIASTVTVLLILGEESCCLWAGDSRLYRLRAGRLVQLSRDQSHVQNLVDRGEIAPEAAAGHPLGHIVTNLVGASDELVLEERRDRLEPGDVLLLCSDGLSGALTDSEWRSYCAKHRFRRRPIASSSARSREARGTMSARWSSSTPGRSRRSAPREALDPLEAVGAEAAFVLGVDRDQLGVDDIARDADALPG